MTTLSRALKAAEEEVGIVIFRRSLEGLFPTQEGEVFLKGAEGILKRLDGLKAEREGDLTEREMEYVMAVREQGSISGAARALFIAQPSLSQAIGKLEAEYGLWLFERNGTGVKETEAGREFLDRVEEIRAAMGELRRELEEENPAVRYEELGTDPFILAAPEGWAKRLGLSKAGCLNAGEMAGLNGQPFVMVARGQRLRETADGIVRRCGIRPDIRCETQGMETAKRLAAAGMGLTLLPESYLNLYSGTQGLVCYALEEEIGAAWRLVVGRRKGEGLPRCAGEFVRLLRERLEGESCPAGRAYLQQG